MSGLHNHPDNPIRSESHFNFLQRIVREKLEPLESFGCALDGSICQNTDLIMAGEVVRALHRDALDQIYEAFWGLIPWKPKKQPDTPQDKKVKEAYAAFEQAVDEKIEAKKAGGDESAKATLRVVNTSSGIVQEGAQNE